MFQENEHLPARACVAARRRGKQLGRPSLQTPRIQEKFPNRSIKRDSLGDMDLSMPYAQLGYDPATGRIAAKFMPEEEHGARKITRERECLTIRASDFVTHYEIKSDARVP